MSKIIGVYNTELPEHMDSLLASIEHLHAGQYSVEIVPYYHKRSSGQNRLLHQNLTILADAFGVSIDEMKDTVKEWAVEKSGLAMHEFTNPITGELKQVLPRSSKMDTQECTVLIEACYQIEKWYNQDGGRIRLVHPEERNGPIKFGRTNIDR